jgi:hypothetical protein
MKKYLLLVLISSAIIGCTKSDLKIVQDGVLPTHKTLTVGEAFSKWTICDTSQSKWSEFQSSNGVKVVEYTCVNKNTQQIRNHLENVISEVLGKDSETFSDAVKFDKIAYVFQWVVNKDNSFDIRSGSIEYYWGSKMYEVPFSSEDIDSSLLNNVYSDKDPLDEVIETIDELAKIRSGQIVNLLNAYYKMYQNAKPVQSN